MDIDDSKKYWRELRLRESLKIAIAFFLSSLTVNIFHIPTLAFIAPISAFVIMTTFPYQSVSMSLQRILGPLIITLIAGLVIYFINQPFIYFVFVCLILMITMYFFAIERLAYGMLLGGIIAVVVMLVGVQDPKSAVSVGLYFVLQCAIGVILANIISKIIWPISVKTHLLPQLAILIKQLKYEFSNEKQLNLDSFTGTKTLLRYCKTMLTHDEFAYYQHLLVSLKIIYLKISRVYKQQAGVVHEHKIDLALNATEHFIIEYLNAFAQAIKNQECCNYNTEKFDQLYTNLLESVNQLRNEGQLLNYPIMHALNFVDSLESIRALKTNIDELCDINNAMINKEAHNKKLKAFLASEEKETIFPLKPEGVKKAFKISLTVVILFLLSITCGLYGGIQALITSVVVAAQPNLGRSKHKLWLRFCGIIVGGVTGFILLMLTVHFGSFFILLAFLFFASLFFAYLALGSERISYLGMQAAIILALILLSSLGPHLSMTIAFHRFIGVIIGGLIGFFITATVFPLNPRKAVQKKIQTAMFICSDILTALLRNQETVHVQGKIQKGLGGHRQLMRDIADYNINSKDKQLMIIFSSIQDCFEQFIRIKELSPNINANPLCLMLQRDLKFVTLKMPALFEALADDVSHKAINRLNVEILMNKFAKTIQAYREKRITTNYTFEQVKTYSSYVSVINHLFQSLIRLKLSILTLQRKDVINQIIEPKEPHLTSKKS